MYNASDGKRCTTTSVGILKVVIGGLGCLRQSGPSSYYVGNVVQRRPALKNSKNITAPGDARRQPEQRSASRAASATTGVAFRRGPRAVVLGRGPRMGGYIRVRFGFRRPWSLRLRSPPAAPEMRRFTPFCAVFTLENKCVIIALLMHSRRRPGDKAPTNDADRPTDDRRHQ